MVRLCHFSVPRDLIYSINRSVFFLLGLCGVIGALHGEAQAAPTFKIAWDAPTTRTDGSALTNLSGYYVYFRTPGGSFNTTNRRTVNGASQTSYTFTDLTPGMYFIAVSAFDSSGLESTRSAELNIASFRPSLEVGVVVGRSFSVKVFSPGGTSAVHTATRTADNDRYVTIGSTTALPSTADIRLKTVGYLAVRASSQSLTTAPTLPALPAGDLDDSNVVDINDARILSQNWFTSNALADLNGSGVVDVNDARYLSGNYFRTGAP